MWIRICGLGLKFRKFIFDHLISIVTDPEKRKKREGTIQRRD
jgi:hypothetical protein